jgi:hypothetical protein
MSPVAAPQPIRVVVVSAAMLALVGAVLGASEHRGQVRFGEVPVHGVAVRATQGDKTVRAVTDAEGRYVLPDLSDGTWTIQVETPGFETMRRDVVVSQDAAAAEWSLRMLSLDALRGLPATAFSKPGPAQLGAVSSVQGPAKAGPHDPPGPAEAGPHDPPGPAEAVPHVETSSEADNRFLINGSVIDGAATPFALQRAFGNVRRAPFPYRSTVFIGGNSSVLDARPYSLTGQHTRQPSYARAQASFTIGGPLQIPRLFRMGSFTATYSRTQNTNATLQTARMPTAAERAGDLSGSAASLIDPATGLAFENSRIPQDRIAPQAQALLALYPLPNLEGGGPFNYQVPVVGATHGDSIQASIANIRIGRRDQLTGSIGLQSTRSDNPDLFGFTDTSRSSSASAGVTWIHRFTPRISGTFRYEFNRTSSETSPYFANRQDVSGEAGIAGNDRDPRNWGPPALSFASGIARLADGTYADDRSYSNSIGYTSSWVLGRHALGYGADYRWQQFDLYSQRDARGSFTFTGASTGHDFADFLLGIPAASSLAFGNPDKYFRQSSASIYANDDFRLTPYLTLNVGVRWEYEAPISERFGRLVNLDITPDFTSAAPLIAGTADETLVRPDTSGIQPRVAVAWRPRLASSVVIRMGYGLYRETNVYRSIADQMAQQAPLSKSLSVQNTPENPLTLEDGFRGSPAVTAATFAIDPDYRVGSAHNWQVSTQRDLPWAMQATVTYLGIRGTHVPRRMLPNTFPAGADGCAGCPRGFVYLMSDGTSKRHSGTIEVRRRQRNGFEASARYTLAKATDNAGLGGTHIAQNWLDLDAEWAPSNFDRRHELIVQWQYTSGMLAGFASFWDGWRGTLLREWTVTAEMTTGSALPLTPVILVPVGGTGMTGTLRPDVTGAPIDAGADGRNVNPAAFTAPAPGQWGGAGRNSIRGPSQFQLNASIGRTFRFSQRVSMDLRIEATNVLNTVTFPDWNTTVGSTQFGLPTRANAMRTLRPSMRVRF